MPKVKARRKPRLPKAAASPKEEVLHAEPKSQEQASRRVGSILNKPMPGFRSAPGIARLTEGSARGPRSVG